MIIRIKLYFGIIICIFCSTACNDPKASENENAKSDYSNLSVFQLECLGFDKIKASNYNEGNEILNMAYEKGSEKASFFLGLHYLNKASSKRNLYFRKDDGTIDTSSIINAKKAIKYLQNIKNIDEAKFELANIYFSTANSNDLYKKAYDMYLTINVDSVKYKANYMLGYINFFGLGVSKNFDSARYYFKKTLFSKYIEVDQSKLYGVAAESWKYGPFEYRSEVMGLGPAEYYIALSFLSNDNNKKANTDSAIRYLRSVPLRPIASYLCGTLLYKSDKKNEALYFLNLACEDIGRVDSSKKLYTLTSHVDDPYIIKAKKFIDSTHLSKLIKIN